MGFVSGPGFFHILAASDSGALPRDRRTSGRGKFFAHFPARPPPSFRRGRGRERDGSGASGFQVIRHQPAAGRIYPGRRANHNIMRHQQNRRPRPVQSRQKIPQGRQRRPARRQTLIKRIQPVHRRRRAQAQQRRRLQATTPPAGPHRRNPRPPAPQNRPNRPRLRPSNLVQIPLSGAVANPKSRRVAKPRRMRVPQKQHRPRRPFQARRRRNFPALPRRRVRRGRRRPAGGEKKKSQKAKRPGGENPARRPAKKSHSPNRRQAGTARQSPEAPARWPV